MKPTFTLSLSSSLISSLKAIDASPEDRSRNPDGAGPPQQTIYHINGVSSKAKNLPEVSSREAASICKALVSLHN